MSESANNNRVSKFESLIREYFKYFYANEEVIYNYRPDWLKNPNTGYNLEIDIYFPHLKLGIECNGGMHELDSQLKRDLIKQELCVKEGIKLISIKYPQKILRMQTELGLVGELPKNLYYRILHYKASKKAFGKFTKKIKKQKRMRVAISLQDKEREFNRQKMLRNK